MSIYLLLAVIVFVVLGYLILKRLKSGTSKKSLPNTSYQELLNTHVEWYRKLGPEDRTRFEQQVTEFLSGITIEGVGTKVNDVDRILIASGAVIPIFGFPGWRYQNLTNVILYPDTFDKEFQFEGGNRNILGMVGTGYMNGQMLLSRAALEKGFLNSPGRENTAIHEFIHLLDGADGATDGIPESLLQHQYSIPWLKMMHQEMHRIAEGSSDINPYALTSDAEFFAVAGEYFFEKPGELAHKHPELYKMLTRIFSQDPLKQAEHQAT